MKKIILSLLLCLVVLSLVSACGKKPDAKTQDPDNAETASEINDEENTQVVNPVTELTEKEAKDIYDNIFYVPQEALNVKWSKLENSDSSALSNQPIVQLDFKLDRLEFSAREQKTGETEKFSDGMNYEWTAKDSFKFKNKSGIELSGTAYRFIGTDEYADLCTWYDPNTGMSYSLSVTDKNLDGFDLLAVVMEIAP